MHEALDAVLARRLGDRVRALDVDGAEALATAARQHADRIDDGACAIERAGDRLRKADIRLHRGNLADAARRL